MIMNITEEGPFKFHLDSYPTFRSSYVVGIYIKFKYLQHKCDLILHILFIYIIIFIKQGVSTTLFNDQQGYFTTIVMIRSISQKRI